MRTVPQSLIRRPLGYIPFTNMAVHFLEQGARIRTPFTNDRMKDPDTLSSMRGAVGFRIRPFMYDSPIQ
jgi:hypothetical protein